MRRDKLHIVAIGSNIWVDYFSEALRYDKDIIVSNPKSYNELKNLSKSIDMLYIMFGWLDKDHLLSYIYCYRRGIPVVIHWIGTDVWRLINPSILNAKMKIKRKILLSLFKTMKGTMHIAGAPWLKDELSFVKIYAQFAPVVCPLLDIATPVYRMPDSVTVMSYIPLGREDFYGEEKVIETAVNNPDINFIVIANSPARKPDLHNVKYFGWLSHNEMEELYKLTKCYMRITRHDGLSSGIEALLRGRYWIFTYDHPFAYKVSTTEEIQMAIDDVKLKTQPNYAGAEFVRKNYSTATVISTLKDYFYTVCKERKRKI